MVFYNTKDFMNFAVYWHFVIYLVYHRFRYAIAYDLVGYTSILGYFSSVKKVSLD